MAQRGSRSRGLRALVVVALVLVVAGGAYLVWSGAGPLPDPEGCQVHVAGQGVALDIEQAENATTIAAVAVRRHLPARAVSIALAAAFQESKLRNLAHGDRDSLGLFQQRPSQGWGTPDEIRDPYYASNAFYDALEKVDGYQTMRITEAAQRVQRSGYPEAYEEHAPGAKALASALTGYSPGRFSCVVDDVELGDEQLGPDGLTPRAADVRVSLKRAFGELPLGGFAPGGVTTGHMAGSAHYEGRALDVSTGGVSPDQRRAGWVIAQYLVGHARDLHVRHVIFDGRIWTAGRLSEQGWRDYDPPEGSGDPAVLEHREHVHVDVA